MSSATVIVTGASKGIGFAVVEYLLSQSTNVVAVARSEGSLTSLRSQKNLEILLGDVKEPEIPAKAVRLAIDNFGGLSGLVLNAAIIEASKIADADIERWKTLYNVNVFSLVAFAKEAIPELRKSRGRIVMVSSGASVRAYQAMGAYGSSKAAVNHLTKTLAIEEKDITTIAFRPGVVDTNMQKAIREDCKIPYFR
ncbi:putative oxidoreductase [Neolecta irregularis DAH-3]|uniref:Putative oxidoreductase n=1 Tax=Neolecta irregularis (strain DAH-3) TaxID=1198029 RepID=A0A1U7LND1_NEOID|nr:putative oxidoreductase [Neolecta irregularis DAH-3]|eukprot:OLL24031.1 putative oxidoreductase [Neolecta irregularis DAH-3]